MENARTQIIATVGPASNDEKTMKSLIDAGVDIFRINLSHSDRETHRASIRKAKALGAIVMIDLPGPKLRIGDTSVPLPYNVKVGERIFFTGSTADFKDSMPSFAIPRGVNFSMAEKDMRVLVDDGKLEFIVKEVSPKGVVVQSDSEGPLCPRKGVAFSIDLTNFPPLVDEDRRAIAELAGEPFDIVAASFVRNEDTITELRDELAKHGSSARIIAKIEDPSGVRNIEAIIKAADGIMVARGDLGVCTPIAALPILQKRLVCLAVYYRKYVIVATQMLESMTENLFPTRAEVTDVANAVLDGADAVMLSGETSVGRHPVKVVETMSKIIFHAESAFRTGLKDIL
ncbi:MAG TPA: pyruvate kinase [Lentisphaeria bacterium]|nr:MAG: pyruvate kinase [Lentisphaerae bacterium GWF2_50_93]HCE42635.1 pyruvate kinase [Lentisphaeria bacterium]